MKFMRKIIVRNKVYRISNREFKSLLGFYELVLFNGPKPGVQASKSFPEAVMLFNQHLMDIIREKKPSVVADISFGSNYNVDPYLGPQPYMEAATLEYMYDERKNIDKYIELPFIRLKIGDEFCTSKRNMSTKFVKSDHDRAVVKHGLDGKLVNGDIVKFKPTKTVLKML